VFENLKSNSNDPPAKWRSISVAALLILVVLLSAGSGIYAGASFFAQQAPNMTVTTTIYTTTTSWMTSTIWSPTITMVVEAVLTTIEYTTSTSTIFVTTSSSTTATTSTRTGTTVTITQLTGISGKVTVKGYLKDAKGNGLSGLQVRITLDAGYTGRVTTTTGGAFSYTGSAPTSAGQHNVTVWFDGTTQYTSSSASISYRI
jgi:hypothetical protein